MRKSSKHREGFTLVEVIFAALIGMIALGVVMSLFIGSQKAFYVGNAFLHIHRNARLALDRIIKDAKGATGVVDNWNGYTTSTDCLVLQVPSIDADGDIIDIDAHHDYIVYRLYSSGDKPAELWRIMNAKTGHSKRADENRVIANNISSLTFSSGGTELSNIADVTVLTNINVAATTEIEVRGAEKVREFLNSAVELRNKQ